MNMNNANSSNSFWTCLIPSKHQIFSTELGCEGDILILILVSSSSSYTDIQFVEEICLCKYWLCTLKYLLPTFCIHPADKFINGNSFCKLFKRWSSNGLKMQRICGLLASKLPYLIQRQLINVIACQIEKLNVHINRVKVMMRSVNFWTLKFSHQLLENSEASKVTATTQT